MRQIGVWALISVWCMCSKPCGADTALYNQGGYEIVFSDYAANFGPAPTKEGIIALLVASYPDPFACSIPEISPNISMYSYIILVQSDDQSTCTDEQRVRNCQAAGALGVIAYPSTPGASACEMKDDGGDEPTITASCISNNDGSLADSLVAVGTVFAKIIQDQEQWSIPSDFWLSLLVLFFASCLMCAACGGMCAMQRRRYLGLEPAKSDVLDMEEALSLPEIIVDETNKRHFETCSVCLGEFNPLDSVRALPCKHVFHTECIVPWLTERNAVCPLCKDSARAHLRTPLLMLSEDEGEQATNIQTHTPPRTWLRWLYGARAYDRLSE